MITNKIFTACSLLAIASIGTTSAAQVVDRYLDNNDCLDGVTHRSWHEAYDRWTNPAKPSSFDEYDREKHKFIVLLYTAGTTADSTYQAYNERGVSAHYLADNNNLIYHAVNEDTDIAFHSGVSSFAGYRSMNFWAIGVDHVNPGYRSNYTEIPGFANPIQLTGDTNYWYPFSETQFRASISLTHDLQERYQIPGWNVVTHADVAPSRKSDIGPMWNYKMSFEEAGVGFWPSESHAIDLDNFRNLSDEDYLHFISSFGYNTGEKGALKAYQLHYSNGNISGELVETTKIDILRHIVSLYDYVDPITHTKFDFLRTNIGDWAKRNPQKAGPFAEYIDIN